MLSNLKRRCPGKGAAEAHGGAGAGAEQLLSAPGSPHSADPAEQGDDADPLTIPILCKAAFLTSCYISLPAHLMFGKETHDLAYCPSVAENPILLQYLPGLPQQFRQRADRPQDPIYWLSYLMRIARKEHTVVPCLLNSLRSTGFVTKSKTSPLRSWGPTRQRF